ncbi:uncharacterized protein LOC123261298 [Cotesia glomerata]|uniref:Uncharacterized protein n=1 Tax=Cotesia glomerata TaxID=32391 RepID=A0AAV7HYS4_COTGL|nr:uncharacterized protein LOC123261298 [Cotesia glomerata]KAH0550369.1 hypothetical protein KQX54_018997 [Cotesia glomerata]
MTARRHIYENTGMISDIINSGTAVINFDNKGITDNALLKKNHFYYKGKIIESHECFDTYIAPGTLVKFSGYNWSSAEYSDCTWYATICWTIDHNPWSSVVIKSGLMFITGRVADLNGRRGVIELTDNSERVHRILFVATKFYPNGQKFSGKILSEELTIGQSIMFDAIPCISEENEEGCPWFASCAYVGYRPYLNIKTPEKVNGVTGGLSPVSNKCTKIDDYKVNTNVSCLKLIKEYMSNPESLFVCGRGIVVDIINDEFGVLLGEFGVNHFQTILFHRRSVFIDKFCLTTVNLAEIFTNGDRLKFIAVGAPPGFFTEWIAVQISVILTDLKKEPDETCSEFSDSV